MAATALLVVPLLALAVAWSYGPAWIALGALAVIALLYGAHRRRRR